MLIRKIDQISLGIIRERQAEKAKEVIKKALELGYEIKNEDDVTNVMLTLDEIEWAKDPHDLLIWSSDALKFFSMVIYNPVDVTERAIKSYEFYVKFMKENFDMDKSVITAERALKEFEEAKEKIKEDTEYRERCKEGKFVSQEDYADLVDYDLLLFDYYGEAPEVDDAADDAVEEVTDNTVTDEDTTTDDAVEEVTDDTNKTTDVTVTNENKEDNKMSASKEVRINDAAFEQPARITETIVPMERFLLNSTDHMNITADVYISPDFERGCIIALDDEAIDDADAWSKFDFETEGLNPEAFGSVENMIESLVDSNGIIPQGMTVRRHMKGAILPTRYGDIYSVMDDIWGDLHVWIWRDGVMKSIDHVKLTVDYSNWQDAIEYILAENIADGLDLAAV